MPKAPGALCAAFLFAKIIQIQLNILQTRVLEELIKKRDDLKIGCNSFVDHLGADLMELPLTARLGTLGAEHGAHVIKPERFRCFKKAFFNHGARDGSGHFRDAGSCPVRRGP